MFPHKQGPGSNFDNATGLGSEAPLPQRGVQRSHLGAGGLLDPRPPQPEVSNQRRRFGEPLKFLPIVFVACTILCLYIIYVFCHCVPLLQLDVAQEHINHSAVQRGRIEIVAFHAITALLLICYVRSILVHPGTIPDNDIEWEYLAQDCSRGEVAPMNLQETKRTGDRRHCKWCGKYKPDRCHHCRVCKICILKMDHHCPWIYNCVGFGNYKCFFLLLLYCVIDLHLIVWTMAESAKAVIENPHTPFLHMFLILFGEVLAFFLGVLTSLFFGFHIWLMVKAMTTIEFCEKSLPKKDKPPKEGETNSYDSSVYDLGLYGNVRAVLGDSPVMWLVPWSRPSGDGLNFMSDETRLTTDMETGRGMRRKTHQRTQRTERRSGLHSSALRTPGFGETASRTEGQGYGPAYYGPP